MKIKRSKRKSTRIPNACLMVVITPPVA